MALFDEVQFPIDISEGAQGGPVYNTVVVITSSGAEQRIGTWGVGRLRWDVSHGLKTPSQMQALVAFFRARGGRLRGFRFKDWTDYTATAQPLTNPYPATTLQLVKTYTDSLNLNTETRLIQKPVTGTVVLTENGTPLTLGTNYTLDTTTGIVTFLSGHPVSGAAYAWSGQFDTPVRFDTDMMKFTSDAVTVANWDSIPVIELLL